MSPVVTTSLPDVFDQHGTSFIFSPAAASLPSTPANNLELQVDWDPATIQAELLQATAILSHRGLKLAAKWAAEQLVGIDGASHNNNSSNNAIKFQHSDLVLPTMGELTPKEWYAKSLLDLSEYLHAAAVLSEPTDDVVLIPGPASDLSSFGVYLRAYALYLAGERRKEEDHLESQRYVPRALCPPCNHSHILDECNELTMFFFCIYLVVFWP